MEGITLVAIPHAPSTTAPRKMNEQQRQLGTLKYDYRNLKQRLAEDVDANIVESPLSLLIDSIYEKALENGLISDESEYLSWLETCSPADISENAAMGDRSPLSKLADCLDELDGILLNATEEHHALGKGDVENYLKNLWEKAFSSYASEQEEWMERAFIKRGLAVVNTLYSDEKERKKLYQYWYTPFMGRRFDAVYENIINVLLSAKDYGTSSEDERARTFGQLAQLISEDRGFGFTVGQSNSAQSVLDNWYGVLTWWLNIPDSLTPPPDELREWQRFVNENLEFRLGVVVGASVARAWSDGVDGKLLVPSLEEWKATTGLPWFGFWVRELLKWGTHEPFVAFSLAQGIAKTRDQALVKKLEFNKWLNGELDEIESDDWIDPQLFLKWKASLSNSDIPTKEVLKFAATLTGSTGQKGTYNVIPTHENGVITWLDPSGYELAKSKPDKWDERYDLQLSDFIMTVTKGKAQVEQVY
jgi:hypothetical protein